MSRTPPADGAGSASGTGAGRGPVRHTPLLPDQALPVLPGLTAAVAACLPVRTGPEPLGGGPDLLAAASGYWARRGLPAPQTALAAAPGAPALLAALCAALGGDVLLPRPCPAWWAPQARMLQQRVYAVPTSAASGGVPDPYALLETVRRVRAEGGSPRVLVLSVADDPTATVPPPELLHETVEAAAGEGLHLVSDETLRDTVHPPAQQVGADADAGRDAGAGAGTGADAGAGTREETAVPGGAATPVVVVSPAEMVPAGVTVVSDLAGAFLPLGWPAAVARFPDTGAGQELRARALDVLAAQGGRVAAPVAAAAAYALAEPEEVTARIAAAARLHARLAAGLHRTVRTAGGLTRPPQAGRHVYADLEPLRPRLAARGIGDAQDLEDHLTARLGTPVPGGHRFGDDLPALRVRLSTGWLLGAPDAGGLGGEALTAAEPAALPPVASALDALASALEEPAATRP